MSTLRTDTLQTTDSAVTIQVKDLPVKGDLNTPVNTIADLKLVDSSKTNTVTLMGNTVKGIGGGTFYYDPTDTTSVEDLSKGIIVGLAGARWKCVKYDGTLNNQQKGIGALNDNGFEWGYTSPGTTVNGNGNKFKYYALNIVDDRAVQQAGLNGATGSKVDGLGVLMNFGGATTRGGRHAIDGVLLQGFGGGGVTDPNNTDRFYVGVQGQVLTQTGDGGTGIGDLRGAYFGSSSYAGLLGGTYVNNLTGAEINTDITVGVGNRVYFHTGVQVASNIGERGFGLDACFSGSCLGGSGSTWGHGLAFHGLNGAPAFANDSIVLKVFPSGTVAGALDRVIDVRGVTTNALISSSAVNLSDNGLDLSKASSFLNLGAANSASSPNITFKSSGMGSAYDARIIATQGSGTVGTGNFQVDANGLITPLVRPTADNAFSVGLPSFRYSVIYSNTGTINTSDAREKTDVEKMSEAELSAAKAISKEIGTYKWLGAVQKKGADARKHVGLTVQKAIEIMEDNGLNAMEYGFICYDEWEATEEVTAEDFEGNVTVVQPAQEAGSRYGFRWDELSAFLAAGFEARLSALEV